MCARSVLGDFAHLIHTENHAAAPLPHNSHAQVLLTAGADASAMDKDLRYPADVAKMKGRLQSWSEINTFVKPAIQNSEALGLLDEYYEMKRMAEEQAEKEEDEQVKQETLHYHMPQQ